MHSKPPVCVRPVQSPRKTSHQKDSSESTVNHPQDTPLGYSGLTGSWRSNPLQGRGGLNHIPLTFPTFGWYSCYNPRYWIYQGSISDNGHDPGHWSCGGRCNGTLNGQFPPACGAKGGRSFHRGLYQASVTHPHWGDLSLWVQVLGASASPDQIQGKTEWELFYQLQHRQSRTNPNIVAQTKMERKKRSLPSSWMLNLRICQLTKRESGLNWKKRVAQPIYYQQSKASSQKEKPN